MALKCLRALHVLSLAGLALVGSLPVLAQVRPDAGALQEQIERDLRRPPPPPPVVRPAGKAEEASVSSPGGLRVVLRQVRLQGNRLIADEELQALLAPSIGQSLSQAELRSLSRTIAAHYRQKGWLARVLLPPQNLSEGVLTIRIVESVLGGLAREGADATRIDPARVESRLLARQRLGEALNTHDIDRGALLADDMAGVTVQGAFQPGERESETRYVYRLADEPLWRGDAKVDNHGSASTGQTRLAAGLGLLSPLGVGELWQTQFAHTRGSDYARLSLGLPVGVEGWRAGLHGSVMRYRVTAPELAALGLEGRSGTFGLEASYPLLRSMAQNLSVELGIEQRRFLNLSSVGTLSDYASTSTQLALNWNRQDRFGGGGSSYGQLALAGIRLHDIRSGPQNNLDPETLKLRYALGRQQTLGDGLMLQVNVSGQWSDEVMDSAEKFSLGGPAGIRAYPAGEGSGERAHLLNLALRWSLDEAWSVSAFYDRGAARDLVLPATRSLQGAGLSCDFVSAGGAFASAVWARRIGHSDPMMSTGQGAPAGPDRHRFWFSAGWRF